MAENKTPILRGGIYSIDRDAISARHPHAKSREKNAIQKNCLKKCKANFTHHYNTPPDYTMPDSCHHDGSEHPLVT